MERRTALVAVGIIAALAVAAVVGVTTAGGDLEERWISDTPRDNRVNHHPVGVGPNATVIAPVAELAGTAGMDRTSCSLVRLAPETGVVRWQTGVPPENCTTHALTGPTIVDLDDDGSLEVLVASTERALHVLDADTGAEEWRVPLATYGYGPPAVADVRGGPAPEVVVSDIGGSVSLVANRSVAWRRTLEEATWASPIVADVTADGRPEIVVGTNDGVVALSPAGERTWTSDADAISTALVPGDGGPPLVLAAESGAVRAIDGTTGDVAWRRNGSWTAMVGAVGDGPTAYVGISGGRVVALDARTGERRWSTALVRAERSITPAPVLGDVTGDGSPELVAVSGTGTVAVLDPADGTELASYQRDVPILTHATVADVTGDGRAEIFVRYGDGRVVSLSFE